MSSLPTAHLMAPLKIREIALRNRIAVSPMCQYSSEDGFANDWHLVHLGSRAGGGAGLGCMEDTAAGGWQCVAPSAVPFRAEDPAPKALAKAEIHALADSFRDAAERALQAGFDVVEIHGAHGYLIHQIGRASCRERE